VEVGGIHEGPAINYRRSLRVRRDVLRVEEAPDELDLVATTRGVFQESGPTSEPLPNPASLVAQWNLLRYPRVEGDAEAQPPLADRVEARLGAVRYTREEFVQIRQATAQRTDPDVPPVPFTD